MLAPLFACRNLINIKKTAQGITFQTSVIAVKRLLEVFRDGMAEFAGINIRYSPDERYIT